MPGTCDVLLDRALLGLSAHHSAILDLRPLMVFCQCICMPHAQATVL